MTRQDGIWFLTAQSGTHARERYRSTGACEKVFHGEGDELPGIWITLPVYDENDQLVGRDYIDQYPFEWADEDGSRALRYGSNYYREAMTYVDAKDKRMRVECFQAAEILYLHAAKRGNLIAYLNLGYIYSYDRCEGKYYKPWREDISFEEWAEPLPDEQREKRAHDCYERACESGDAEAYYKLGDMKMQGRGCKVDEAEAFRCYGEAFKRGEDGSPTAWGSAAIRLADCYENAKGCKQDFEKALEFYKTAATALEISVRNGNWYYRKQLRRAQDGVKRITQELSGEY